MSAQRRSAAAVALLLIPIAALGCPAFLSDDFGIGPGKGPPDGAVYDGTIPLDEAGNAPPGTDAALDGGGGSVVDADAAIDTSGLVALTLIVTTYGPASVGLASQPSGVSCSAPSCTQQVAYFAPGASVQLSASPAAGTLVRWTGACSGTSSSCTVTMSAPQSVTVVANAWNYVFTTSTTTTANLGGLTGADSLCQQAATRAAVPGASRAWLSTDAASAISRFSGARGWIRVDGKPVFDSLPEPMYYPIALDESGKATTSFAWTGTTDATGGRDNCSTCLGWTTDGVGPDGGYDADDTCPGAAEYTNGAWSDGTYVIPCNQQEALFCFGTDLHAPLALTRSTGRVAFQTKSSWDPTTGVDAADSLCGLEADAGSLLGTFLAFLSTSTVSAAKRFDLTGPNWVRVDGLPIATSPTALAIGTIQTTITVASDGTYVPPSSVWTGATSPDGTPNTPSNAQSSCADWSAAGVTGGRGRSNSASDWFENNYIPPACTDTFPVYCFQE